MNLPFILDVALGLIFIYLILSLLACEIQELITTVLQWRAEHLRRSVEIFLAGDAQNSEKPEVIQLVNRIYGNPLIKSINQEAKGLLVTLPRRATWAVASFFSLLRKSNSRFRKETVFGDQKRSAPSYIGGDNFADTFMDTLQLPTLVKKITEIRLEKFKKENLDEIIQVLITLDSSINNQELSSDFAKSIAKDYQQLEFEYNRIVNEFKNEKYDIHMSINRMRDRLDKYIYRFQSNMENHEDILDKPLQELKFLRKDIFEDPEKAIVLAGLKPNINEIVKSIKKGNDIHDEVIANLQDKDSQTYKKVKELIDILPDSVVNSIETMAKRAQMRAKTTEEGINLLRKEIENSFDSSMERASGVYKRNAKGVAILIGITLAIATNTDTFHIVDRLSKDTLLREIIIKKAVEAESSNALGMNQPDPNDILKDVELPIGWTIPNLTQQICGDDVSPENAIFCVRGKNGQSKFSVIKIDWKNFQVSKSPIFRILIMIGGWFISGIAIAMGAPFWFDLLSKVMNVRNAGKKGKQSSKNQDE
ncbi:hypothetical protein [Dolichospermum circinale]|uniref:hypothetical protein n=1 Tax=Dolichospermum circinale TaxID=109265 RepID=UPI00232EC444|nr:hypothetical protein [Dolichospermum circinale]MDB9455629.1 hypothetical protein [Dolichospermum circinale CS-541/06]MDB9461607.1 hypothetical protein [Dolichospermum circinale CS-541/04]MDB9547765.1 hypothetical protein [Dolichospermum circinale CS-1031]